MFSGFKKEKLSDVKEMDISQQIKTIVCSPYKGYCSVQNLEFRNKEGQQIGNTEIQEDSEEELDDPIEE